jgi:hypothetical protein
MSRSRKKHPYIKDKGTFMRKVCSRAHRSVSRQICHNWRKGWYCGDVEYLYSDPEFPDRRSLVNPYDICDNKFKDPVYGYRK